MEDRARKTYKNNSYIKSNNLYYHNKENCIIIKAMTIIGFFYYYFFKDRDFLLLVILSMVNRMTKSWKIIRMIREKFNVMFYINTRKFIVFVNNMWQMI